MLVSCIMPTRGRPEFAREAVGCFLAQTWKAKELIIVDDADDRSFPAGIYLPNIRYHLVEQRMSIGAKRNYAIECARGEIIVHFDDDDWSAPNRIEDQVVRLGMSRKQVTGYHSMTFRDLATGKRWKYTGQRDYSLGSALCYRREFWARHPFPDGQVGEDGFFLRAARREGQIVSVDAGEMMWASTHVGNSSPRATDKPQWKELAA